MIDPRRQRTVPVKPIQARRVVEYHLIILWLLVLSLAGLRLFEFYEGSNQAQKVNSVLWKLKKGQAEILEYLEYQDKYDDD